MKKIMFNDKYGLTDAVLQGRKPMTRRICKEYATKQPILSRDVESFRFYPDENIVEFLMKDGTTKVSVPPYKNNEVVAVAQSYKDLKLSYIPHIDEPDFKTCTKHAPQWGNPRGMKGWSNKMFVRPDIMPHQIRITDLKIERLQDITEEDILREGTTKSFYMEPEDVLYYYEKVGQFKDGTEKIESICFLTARDAFAALIDKVSGKGTWELNPYVFAYTFELIK